MPGVVDFKQSGKSFIYNKNRSAQIKIGVAKVLAGILSKPVALHAFRSLRVEARVKKSVMLLELRKACKITRLRLVFLALFLTLATFPRVWIRPSKP